MPEIFQGIICVLMTKHSHFRQWKLRWKKRRFGRLRNVTPTMEVWLYHSRWLLAVVLTWMARIRSETNRRRTGNRSDSSIPSRVLATSSDVPFVHVIPILDIYRCQEEKIPLTIAQHLPSFIYDRTKMNNRRDWTERSQTFIPSCDRFRCANRKQWIRVRLSTVDKILWSNVRWFVRS